MSGLRRVIGEIHRRSLWQVLGIYVAGSWAALQVVDVLAQTAGLPDWFPPLALGLLIIGLPVVLATAFVQEGLSANSGADRPVRATVAGSAPALLTDELPARRLFTWRNAILGGVAAFALWGVAAAGWMLLGGNSPSESARAAGAGSDGAEAVERASVAVLPFAMRSAVAEDSFFVQGVHDDILTQLARIEDLKVISRTSVMQYAGSEKGIRQIAGELGVATVLEGGVQRAGDRVRVTAQLIDADTDAHLWAESYDEALTTENLFAIQTEIAQEIARALEAHLSRAEEARLATRPTENLEAYDLYNRARYLWAEATAEGRLQALDLYKQAARLDPNFAAAHAGFAATYIWLESFGDIPTTTAAREEAREAVRRALALDPDLGEAHHAQGNQLEFFDLDLDGAERAYRRATELSPNSAAFHNSLAGMYLNRGQLEEARTEYQRAVDVDPLAFAPRVNLSFVEFVGRDYHAAERQASRVIELDPGHSAGYYMLCAALTFQDRHEEAIAAARAAVERDSTSAGTLIVLGFAHARAGHRDSALAIAADVEERGGSPKEVALVHAALGDIDRAFEYLEVAFERSRGELAALDIDPSADPLRDDPRYSDLLKRAGLEPSR